MFVSNLSLKLLDSTASTKPCIKILPVIAAQLAVLTWLALAFSCCMLILKIT